MSTAEIETPPVVNTRRLEGTLALPTQFGLDIPNHLVETRTFVSVSDGAVVKTQPRVVHFDGLKVGKLHQQTLRIRNCSRDSVNVHIVPPSTDFFSISYSKRQSWLVPGLALNVTVSFKPTEWKYYYDSVRIHCKGEENILVPIHAYPVMNTARFPRSVRFPPTPVGQSCTHTLSLESEVPVQFEYKLNYEQAHPAFSVQPMQGIVPANGGVEITVTFAPTEFSTAIMMLQLEVSQFNAKPLVTTFTGTSIPGLLVEQLKNKLHKKLSVVAATPSRKSLPTSASKRPSGKRKAYTATGQASDSLSFNKPNKPLLMDGIQFPDNLDSHHAVNRVLCQQRGKMKAAHLRQVASSMGPRGTSGGGSQGASRQLKEAMFVAQVKEIADAERANKLKWETHLGSNFMTDKEKESVLHQRKLADETYSRLCHIANEDEERERRVTECVKRRTRRKVGELVSMETPQFNPLSNNNWFLRHRALERFVGAVSKVIMRQRCQKRLDTLKKLVHGAKLGRKLSELPVDPSDVKSFSPHISLTPSLLLAHTLPHYSDCSKSDSLVSSQPVAMAPVTVKQERDFSLLKLRVPKMYQLLGYSHVSTLARPPYADPGLAREWKSGAEEELLGLSAIPGVNEMFLQVTAPQSKDMEIIELEEEGDKERKSSPGVILPLSLPPTLLRPLPCDPWHLLNPSPSVVGSLLPLLPNSEVTLEHYLLPLPSPTARAQPHPKLDPLDGIPGLMKWRQFPTHCLVATGETTPSLSSRWKPRLSDPFSRDLLPLHATPHQLPGPQPDDYIDDSANNLQTPTEEMLKAEFHIPPARSKDAFHSRLLNEEELFDEQWQKFDQLGAKIRTKHKSMLALLSTNHDCSLWHDQ